MKIFYKIPQDVNLSIIQVLSCFKVSRYRSSSFVLTRGALRRLTHHYLERDRLQLCKRLTVFTSFRISPFFLRSCLSTDHLPKFKVEKTRDTCYFIDGQFILIWLNFEDFCLPYFLNFHNLQLNEYLKYVVLQIRQFSKIYLQLIDYQKPWLNHPDCVDFAYMMIAIHLLGLLDSMG